MELWKSSEKRLENVYSATSVFALKELKAVDYKCRKKEARIDVYNVNIYLLSKG